MSWFAVDILGGERRSRKGGSRKMEREGVRKEGKKAKSDIIIERT